MRRRPASYLRRMLRPPAPVVVSEVSLMSPAAAASPKSERASEDVRVKPGQTLYQISVDKFGKYDEKSSRNCRGLNPGLDNPDRIRTGQKIRVPATATFPQKHSERPSSLQRLHPQRQENNEQELRIDATSGQRSRLSSEPRATARAQRTLATFMATADGNGHREADGLGSRSAG